MKPMLVATVKTLDDIRFPVEEGPQSIEYVGYIKSNWDRFNFSQYCYTLLGDVSIPVPEESENVD